MVNNGVMVVGGTYDSNNCGRFQLLDVNGRKCTIKFLDTENECVRTYWDAVLGEVFDKTKPIIQGIGFTGEGAHRPSLDRKHTQEYTIWRGMLTRCYTKKRDAKTNAYSGVTVCTDWHNYQNFAEWYINQPNYLKEGFLLDKDLTIFGSTLYSQDTCELIPSMLNTLFVGVFNNKDRIYPKGVSRSKRDGYYRFRVSDPIEKKCITNYGKDPIKLGLQYAKLKQEITNNVVDLYEKDLSKRIITNLRNNTESYLVSLMEGIK